MIKIILEYCFNVSSNLGQWKRANLMKFIYFLFFFVAKLKLKKLTKKKYKLIRPQKWLTLNQKNITNQTITIQWKYII